MFQPITCEVCGAVIGAALPPTLADVKAGLDGTPFAAVVGAILPSLPPDAMQGVGRMLRYRCVAHSQE